MPELTPEPDSTGGEKKKKKNSKFWLHVSILSDFSKIQKA
jgi:hypothetical protein